MSELSFVVPSWSFNGRQSRCPGSGMLDLGNAKLSPAQRMVSQSCPWYMLWSSAWQLPPIRPS